MFNKEKWSIIKDVALLREQRNLIKALHSFHADNDSLKTRDDGEGLLGAIFGSIPEISILGFLYKKEILLDDKNKNIEVINRPVWTNNGVSQYSSENWDRRSKIGVLYQSCKDNDFIKPLNVEFKNKGTTAGTSTDLGVRITSRGTDLLNLLGFMTIAFEKHSKLITFVWGIIAGIFGAVLVWIFGHLPGILKLVGIMI